jgi:NTE family protein
MKKPRAAVLLRAGQVRRAASASYRAREVIWVDGGLLDNYPVDVFDRSDRVVSRWPTIGMKLSATSRPTNRTLTCTACSARLPPDFARCDQTPTAPTSRTRRPARTIFIDTLGIAATDFHLTEDQQNALYRSGQVAAHRWIGVAAPPPPMTTTAAATP